MGNEVQTPARPLDDHEPPPAELEAWQRWAERRFDNGRQHFADLREEMKRNTDITSEIRDLVLMGKSFFRFLQNVGRVLRWCWNALYGLVRVCGALAAAIGAIWALLWALKSGGPPPKP